MGIQFSVKTRFIVNGKEYGSVEEMPDEIRSAYGKAIQGPAAQGRAGTIEMEKSRLVFNAKEYEDEDAMPEEERELYKVVMKAMEKEGIPVPGWMDKNTGVPLRGMRISDGSGTPIVPEPFFSPRKWIAFAAILAVLLGATYLLAVSGR